MKIRILFALLFVLICCCYANAAENGLVASYNFDDGQNIIKDSSGKGYDGTLVGGAHLVSRDGGYAIQCTSTKDSVDFGSPASMMMKGDMSIEVWVKTSSRDRDDQIILGDTSSLAINRNFYLYNSKGILRFDHGNGQNSESYSLDTPIFTGEWQHIAFVAEFPNFYFYVNGKLVKRGTMQIDITPTPGGSRAAGGWWAGFFDGQLDDIRLYKRALTGKEIAADAGLKNASQPIIDLNIRPVWDKEAVMISAWADRLSAEKNSIKVSVKSPASASSETKIIPLKGLRTGSGRASGAAVFGENGLKKGDYKITTKLINENGKVLSISEQTWKCGGMRSWIKSKIGETSKVMAPWTPITVKKQNGNIDIGVWGRTYRWGKSAFPSEITTKDGQILSSPVVIAAVVDGKSVQFNDCLVRVESSSPSSVILAVTAKAGDVSLTARHKIEYDGFIKTFWKISSVKKHTIESLTFDIPFKSEYAKYLYYSGFYEGLNQWSKVGTIADGLYERSFSPYIWLGDNERGMQWVAESPVNWFNKDQNKAIQINKESDVVNMKLVLVDKSVDLEAGKNINYTFGLQASPVKPITEDCWDYRIIGSAVFDYGHDYDLLTKKVDGVPILDYLKNKGVKTILVGNWTKVMTYTSPVGHEKEFKELISECHKRGIKVMPYFGYQISELAPEWPDFGQDVVVLPAVRNPDLYPGMEPQMVDSVCLRSVWKNFMLVTLAELIDNYDIDGIYLDSTILPFPCLNPAHGCGYTDSEGKLRPNFAMFDIRDFCKRLYEIVKTRKSDGIIDMHVFDGMNLPALAWGTSYWTGEQLPAATGNDYSKVLSLDRFRTDFMGVQWGVPAEFLHYRLGDYKKAFAIALLHDVPVRPSGIKQDEFEVLSSIWKLWDDFGRKQAEWLPYFKNETYVQASPSGIYCSLYKHPKNGVVAVVSNLDNSDQAANINFNLKMLGLNENNISVKDALSGETIPINNGYINLNLPSVGWKLLWLKD